MILMTFLYLNPRFHLFSDLLKRKSSRDTNNIEPITLPYLKEYSILEIPGYGIYRLSLNLKSVKIGPKSNTMLVFTL